MSDEFTIDIDKALENAKNTDHIGFDNPRPDGLESVKRSIDNCEFLSGLDHKLMKKLQAGDYTEYITLNSVGRQSRKIVIEYDITNKNE